VTVDKRKLMRYDFQSRQLTELANVGTDDVVWGPDGETIYSTAPNEPVIYRAEVAF
jgi:hypothetical protein